MSNRTVIDEFLGSRKLPEGFWDTLTPQHAMWMLGFLYTNLNAFENFVLEMGCKTGFKTKDLVPFLGNTAVATAFFPLWNCGETQAETDAAYDLVRFPEIQRIMLDSNRMSLPLDSAVTLGRMCRFRDPEISYRRAVAWNMKMQNLQATLSIVGCYEVLNTYLAEEPDQDVSWFKRQIAWLFEHAKEGGDFKLIAALRAAASAKGVVV